MRKSSFIEFTPISNSYSKGKKENSATRKSSRKSSDHMQKINEFEEEHDKPKNDEILEISPEKNLFLEKKSSSIYYKMTKKRLFEEFLLIGIDKNEFLKIDSSKNAVSKGYHTPQIMFEYPVADISNENATSDLQFILSIN